MFIEEIGWSVKSIVRQALVVVFDLTLISVFYHFLSSRDWEDFWEIIVGMLCGAVLLNLWWIFTKLSIAVNDNQLQVRLGPFRDTIDLDQITSCCPTNYSWLAWGGVRLGFKTRIYYVPGRTRRAVELRMRDGWRIIFSSNNPAVLCQAIQAVRGSTTPISKTDPLFDT